MDSDVYALCARAIDKDAPDWLADTLRRIRTGGACTNLDAFGELGALFGRAFFNGRERTAMVLLDYLAEYGAAPDPQTLIREVESRGLYDDLSARCIVRCMREGGPRCATNCMNDASNSVWSTNLCLLAGADADRQFLVAQAEDDARYFGAGARLCRLIDRAAEEHDRDMVLLLVKHGVSVLPLPPELDHGHRALPAPYDAWLASAAGSARTVAEAEAEAEAEAALRRADADQIGVPVLAKVAIGLAALDLPVLLVLAICELAGGRRSVAPSRAWEIAKLVKRSARKFNRQP